MLPGPRSDDTVSSFQEATAENVLKRRYEQVAKDEAENFDLEIRKNEVAVTPPPPEPIRLPRQDALSTRMNELAGMAKAGVVTEYLCDNSECRSRTKFTLGV